MNILVSVKEKTNGMLVVLGSGLWGKCPYQKCALEGKCQPAI